MDRVVGMTDHPERVVGDYPEAFAVIEMACLNVWTGRVITAAGRRRHRSWLPTISRRCLPIRSRAGA
jgi:hypothetical protein